jgi:hypothetical protein
MVEVDHVGVSALEKGNPDGGETRPRKKLLIRDCLMGQYNRDSKSNAPGQEERSL